MRGGNQINMRECRPDKICKDVCEELRRKVVDMRKGVVLQGSDMDKRCLRRGDQALQARDVFNKKVMDLGGGCVERSRPAYNSKQIIQLIEHDLTLDPHGGV